MSAGIRAPGGGAKPKNGVQQKGSVTRAVSPPDELMGDMAIDAWNRTIRILIKQGFEMQDCYLLMEYCNTVQILYDANLEIKNDGLSDETAAGGAKLGSAIKTRDKCISQLIRLSVVLRLDPTSRIRSDPPNKDNTPGQNEFNQF